MRSRIHSLVERLRKQRSVAATAGVFGFLILSSSIALPRQARQAGNTLICSAKANLSCNRSIAKGLLDPHCRDIRVDHIVSGALRLASSL